MLHNRVARGGVICQVHKWGSRVNQFIPVKDRSQKITPHFWVSWKEGNMGRKRRAHQLCLARVITPWGEDNFCRKTSQLLILKFFDHPISCHLNYRFFTLFDGFDHPKQQDQFRYDMVLVREAPLKKTQGLFGHCPNSNCTPPPFTQPGTLGHLISGPTWATAIWTSIFIA